MPNTRKLLIVDDDPEMRDALTEQLSLYDEFEACWRGVDVQRGEGTGFSTIERTLRSEQPRRYFVSVS